jgi:hypothetical protein
MHNQKRGGVVTRARTNPTVDARINACMILNEQIQRAGQISIRLQSLLIGKSIVTRTLRDPTSLHYWGLIFELHQGIVVLISTKHYAPAFALMRPIAESFCRLYLVMYGSEAQFDSILKGTYATEFSAVLAQIDAAVWKEPLLGSWLTKERMRVLHGFTHGGTEQLIRQFSGRDIIPNYPENEVVGVLDFTTFFAFMTALFVTDFLGCVPEHQAATEMFKKFLPATAVPGT